MIQCPDNSQTELLQAPVQPTFPVFGLRTEVLNQLVELSTGNREDLLNRFVWSFITSCIPCVLQRKHEKGTLFV